LNSMCSPVRGPHHILPKMGYRSQWVCDQIYTQKATGDPAPTCERKVGFARSHPMTSFHIPPWPVVVSLSLQFGVILSHREAA
jgi:hypothetical protein